MRDECISITTEAYTHTPVKIQQLHIV